MNKFGSADEETAEQLQMSAQSMQYWALWLNREHAQLKQHQITIGIRMIFKCLKELMHNL